MNSNAFVRAAETAKQRQASQMQGVAHGETEGLVSITVRIPRELRTRANQHRVDTGESVAALVKRLLEAELR